MAANSKIHNQHKTQ